VPTGEDTPMRCDITTCVRVWSAALSNGDWVLCHRRASRPEPKPKLLSTCPLARLPNWFARGDEPLTNNEMNAVRGSIKRGSLFGNETSIESTARRFGIESTLRPNGRQRAKYQRWYSARKVGGGSF
jgi:putative transposase